MTPCKMLRELSRAVFAAFLSHAARAQESGALQVWRLPELVQTLTLKGHRRGVWSAAFSPVDQAVLTGSGDATVRLWALTDGSCLKTFEGHSASVLRACFISYGAQVGPCRRWMP